MSQYRPTVGIEPINEYEKTKQDVITAYKSFHALSSIQQEKLAKKTVWSGKCRHDIKHYTTNI